MSDSETQATKEEKDRAKRDESYFQQWYQEHGDQLNKSRKRRYQDDPAYRERVLVQNRDARKRRRVEQLEERKKENAARKTRVNRSWKTHDVSITDEAGEVHTTKLFTIGAAAKMLKCSVQAIRLWERKGILPETPLRGSKRGSKGDRLYTADMIEMFREVLEEKGHLSDTQIRPRPLRVTERTIRFSDGRVKENVKLFRIGELAEAAQRTVVTLEQLEQRGYLPPTPFRVSDLGYRLYTEPMISAVKTAFEKRAWEIRGDEEWAKFRDEVHAAWRKQGVIGAKILKRKTE
jgi:DNA-binding transcriptional MerR regulator